MLVLFRCTLPLLPLEPLVSSLGRAGNVALLCSSGRVPILAFRCCCKVSGEVEVLLRSSMIARPPLSDPSETSWVALAPFLSCATLGDLARLMAPSLNHVLTHASCSRSGCCKTVRRFRCGGGTYCGLKRFGLVGLVVTTRSILPLPRDRCCGRRGGVASFSLGGRGGLLGDLLSSAKCSPMMGIGWLSIPGVLVFISLAFEGSGMMTILPFGRLIFRPRLCGEASPNPASSPSLISPNERSRALAALSRRMALTSASRSLRFLSRRCCFRCSFSISKAHQPARESQRCESTFSMTVSMSTPALRILSSVSFSSEVENGAGCCTFKISCCAGACSASQGSFSMSARHGRRIGLLDNIFLMRSFAISGT